MVTIHDIARETGVSPNTVARILAGRRGRPYNESKVLKAAQRLGYVRNLQASNLRSGKSGFLGLLVPEIRNPNYTEFFQLLQDRAIPLGYQILLFSSAGKMQQELKALELMEQSRVEAVIVNAAEGESDEACDAIIQRLLNRKIPVVLAGRPERSLHADEVVVLNEKAIHKAVSYLVKTGRKRIAFLCGDKRSLASTERARGYSESLKKHGLEARPEWISFGEYTPDSGYQQATQLLALKNRPDAIVAGNDLLAIGAIRAIQNHDLSVPDDIAVTGFDDIPLASLVTPQLTTLRQPNALIAQQVMDLIHERLSGNGTDEPRRLTYDLELVVRGSA